VDIFKKPDQLKSMRKEIKRTVMDQSFGNNKLVKTLQERFLDLARTKYRR
jgi:type I restriction enzyme R subunit